MTQRPRVLISYSHDSPQHKQRVLELSERLRADGIDATIDQYIETTGPPEGWPRWMDEQLRTADFVLLICTATYRKRVEGREEQGRGHGVLWEASLIYQHIYNAGTKNERFVPVLLEGASQEDIPIPLQGVANYRPTDQAGYEGLYRRLTGQVPVEKGRLGSLRPLSPHKIELSKLPTGSGAASTEKSADSRVVPATRTRIATAGIVVLAGALLSTGAWLQFRTPGVYRVRVSVLDPQGRKAEGAQVASSIGGEILRSGDGWELVIPAASKPANQAVVIRAAVPSAFLKGETEVRLGSTSAVTATVSLRTDTSAHVHGIIVDSAQRALAGVRVSVVGQSESVVTKEDGAFSLPAHATDGQQVQLRAEKVGIPPVTQWHPAGDAPATVVVE